MELLVPLSATVELSEACANVRDVDVPCKETDKITLAVDEVTELADPLIDPKAAMSRRKAPHTVLAANVAS